MREPLHRSRPDGFDIRPASQTAAVRVAEDVWLSEGLSNAYLVVTPAGRVVVNTGMGFEGPLHRRLFDAVDAGPIRYILLTQGHVDHVGGVEAFREPGTEIVAQANNRVCQEDDARIHRFRVAHSAPFFPTAVGTAERNLHVQARPQPTVTFTDRYDVDLGGVRFELIATPGGETVDSACIWLPERRIAFVGNVFSALFGHFPNLVTLRGDRYRAALPFVDAIERVRALRPELLLTGHFGPIHGADVIDAELVRLRDAVRFVHDATVAGMNDGTDVRTLMRDIRLPPELAVGEGYGCVAWSVRAIWEHYAGWFHQRSTTELYAVPPDDAHADVVALAGGAAVVAAKAHERVASGDAVTAIHLAEMALAAEPGSRPALEAFLAAHEALLAERGGRNFWETGWLRHQIERTRRALA
ncbi:MAG TPA: alkyl sulfatase dimerization domain-containing protein [Candidatus Binatia bacterium]|jgi:alkyl sulfatase BDS1-like metallo-beta-lactamase superfamily hydrolase|nr:alkyl sulfatase dimerization domain-containing protein [Candidatus Binatia bacterium]